MTIRKAKEIALSLLSNVQNPPRMTNEELFQLAWGFLRITDEQERVHTIETLEKKIARLEAAQRLTPFDASTKEGDYLVRATQRESGDTVFVSGHYSGPIDGSKGVWSNQEIDIFTWDDGHEVSTVTHCMPLPAPPEEHDVK